MEKDFEVRTALLAFQKIKLKGQQTGPESYHYNGVHVESDFDGYNLMMKSRSVTLYIYFHSTYKFDYEQMDDLDEFVKIINQMAQED